MRRGGSACALVAAAVVACQAQPAPPGDTPSPAASPASSAAASPAPVDMSVAKPLSSRGARELAASLAHQKFEAQLVPGIGKRIAIEEDTFVLAAGDPVAPLEAAAKVVHETVEALWHGPFYHRPEQAVVVYVFATRNAYEAYRQKWAPETDPRDLSLYRSGDHTILFCVEAQDISGLRHEVTHPLLNADFPHASAWLKEGLPALMEVSEVDASGQIHGKAHFRLQTLRRALHDDKLAPLVRLETLFPLQTPDQFYDSKVALRYALSREALRWLDSPSKRQLWAWYRRWREDVLTDPTGEKSFEAVVGPVAQATDEWRAWIQSSESE